MKGIVFTQLLEMVEQKFGYAMVDQMITESKVPSGGTYTSVGLYPHTELEALLEVLSRHLNKSVEELQEIYGEYLFGVFYRRYPHFFEGGTTAFSFLSQIENKIHDEVKKLYPDAELPSIKTELVSPDELIMVYESEKKMGAFAKGLIKGCLQHFGIPAKVEKEQLDEEGRRIRFRISK